MGKITKVDAIEQLMRDNGGTASWSIIYDNINKYYPTAKNSVVWQEGLRGVLYREMKKSNRFKKIGLGFLRLVNIKKKRSRKIKFECILL